MLLGHPRLPVLQPAFDRRSLFMLGVATGLAACADDRTVPDPTPSRDGGATANEDAAARDDDATSAQHDDATTAHDDAMAAHDDAAAPDAAAPDAAPQDAGTIDSGAADAGMVEPPPGYIAVGPIANFPVDRWSLHAGGGTQFIVGRDSAGIFIYSAICTHNGCTVPAPAGPGRNSTCPCHLSVFDPNGARVSGVARTSLAHRAALVANDTLYVNTRMNVPATDRTPVP